MTQRLQHPWVEAAGRDLYVWRIPAQPSTRELEEALKAIQAWMPSLDSPYGWVNDPRKLRLASIALERKMVADHLRFVEPYSRRYCAGMATIVSSSAIRGIATAVAWLYDYPFPVRYCEDEDESLDWVRLQMESHARP